MSLVDWLTPLRASNAYCSIFKSLAVIVYMYLPQVTAHSPSDSPCTPLASTCTPMWGTFWFGYYNTVFNSTQSSRRYFFIFHGINILKNIQICFSNTPLSLGCELLELLFVVAIKFWVTIFQISLKQDSKISLIEVSSLSTYAVEHVNMQASNTPMQGCFAIIF